jgi:hypothetical protein
MELLVMLSASGIASEELGIDVDSENPNTEASNATAGPSRQGNPLLSLAIPEADNMTSNSISFCVNFGS